MVRSFENDFDNMMRRLQRRPLHQPNNVYGTILTGTLFAPVLAKRIAQLNDRFGTRIQVEAVENKYFGGDVSVAGLLTGGDLLAAHDRIRGDFVLVPKQVLKSDEDIMLDGMKIENLHMKLGLPIHAVDIDSFFTFLAEPSFLLTVEPNSAVKSLQGIGRCQPNPS